MLFFCSADTYKLIKCTVSDSLGEEAWKWLQQYRYSLIWSYLLIIKATFHICKLSWLIQTFMNLHLYFVNRLHWFLHCTHCVLCHWNLNVVFSFHNHVDYSTQFVKLSFDFWIVQDDHVHSHLRSVSWYLPWWILDWPKHNSFFVYF